MEHKITRLTRLNVDALHKLLTPEELQRVTVNATTAVFAMDASEAARLVDELRSRAAQRHGTNGHPYQSLHAVARKVASLP